MENDRHRYDLGEILVQHKDQLQAKYQLRPDQEKVLQDLTRCRTAALGGHQDKCDHCDHRQNSYNSCRNRHCPKCQYIKQVEWVDRLKHNLPPTRYFHLIFTIPQHLHQIFYTNKKVCYNMLFRSSTQAVQQAARGPGGSGARVGGVCLLHTWGQALTYHPHIHMIVPAGGISEDRMEWIPSSKKFFVPAKVLSKIFRGILCKMLAEAIGRQEVFLPEGFSWDDFKKKLYKKNWNVHIKSALAGTDRVIEYLGQYTHRIAISNSRIINVKDDHITFKIKDYRKNGFTTNMTLSIVEFMRRFFQHVIPRGFCKIRYFGFMSLSIAKEMVDLILELLDQPQFLPIFKGLNGMEIYQEISGHRQRICPHCNIGVMRLFKERDGSG